MMNLPVPMCNTASVNYFSPLHVDTNIVYDIDMGKFPGLKDYEPSLIISPDYLDTNVPSCGGIQDDLYNILDSIDFTEEDMNCQTVNIVEEILDTAMCAEETPAVSCDVSRLEICEYNQENIHNTYLVSECCTSQEYSNDIISEQISSSGTCARVSESRSFSMCYSEDRMRMSNRKRRLSSVSECKCSKRRKISVNDFYKSVTEDAETVYPVSDVITNCMTFPRKISLELETNCNHQDSIDIRQC